jgi:polysaccharide export outer membrane protein
MKKSFTLMVMLMIIFFGLSLSDSQETKEIPGKSLPQSQVPPDSDKYVIGPGDVLQIQVWKEETLSQSVMVRSDGKISLPLIDEVQATGLTPLKLKEVLTERFKEFVDNPLITVMV